MKGEKKLESMERVKSRMQASRILLDLNGGRSPDCNIDSKQSITELISDSRRVTPGSAFFALPVFGRMEMNMCRKLWIVEHELL